MKNKLFYGDNLEVLRTIYSETVDLCYIDPPFNSKRNYNQIYNNIGKEDRAQAQAFIDTWTWDTDAEEGLANIKSNDKGAYTVQSIKLIIGLENVLGKDSLLAYLVSMTQRIAEIHRVLKTTGSLYLHCDPTASHYLKLILDSMFCPQGGDFQNEIVWHYRRWTGKAKKFQELHDIIFYYTKSKDYTFNVLYTDYTDGSKERKEQGVLHRFKKGEEPHLVSNGEVDEKGVRDNDVWQIPFIAPSAKERLGYPTQKPEKILEKIIQASSNEGDVVLDCYCGCGTTIAVAQKLNRNWIGVDITYQSIALIVKRLLENFGQPVIDNVALTGIPKDMDGAYNLANKKDDRLRKEFEKWAILTYTNNQAIVQDKKGSDGGIDGTSFIADEDNKTECIIFSVKSGNVQVSHIRDLHGVIQREKAVMGILITLENPTAPMILECRKAGAYKNYYVNKSYQKLQIVTIKQILDGERLDVPLPKQILKKAILKAKGNQTDIFDESPS